MKTQQVIAAKIVVTNPTVKLTGIDSYQELVSKKDTIFGDLSESKLLAIYNQMNPKVDANDVEKFEALSKDEKRAKLVNELTVQVQFRQSYGERSVNLVSLFMDRDNISEQSEGSKVFYQTATLSKINALGIQEGKAFELEGKVVYLMQRTTFTPVIDKNTGNVTSNPKRAGKGGDVLTKGGKVLFIITDFIITNSKSYAELEAEELDNRESMKHDGKIDAQTVPSDKRTNGQLSEEYQAWLNGLVMKSEGHFTAIN